MAIDPLSERFADMTVSDLPRLLRPGDLLVVNDAATLPASLPVHRVVEVDVFLPGCPPSADLIYHTLDELLEGRVPDTARIARFGA